MDLDSQIDSMAISWFKHNNHDTFYMTLISLSLYIGFKSLDPMAQEWYYVIVLQHIKKGESLHVNSLNSLTTNANRCHSL